MDAESALNVLIELSKEAPEFEASAELNARVAVLTIASAERPETFVQIKSPGDAWISLRLDTRHGRAFTDEDMSPADFHKEAAALLRDGLLYLRGDFSFARNGRLILVPGSGEAGAQVRLRRPLLDPVFRLLGR